MRTILVAPELSGLEEEMVFRLDGKIALVTGATSGIGVGICEALLAQGARVAFCGRRVERGRTVERQLGPQARFFPADVTVENDVRGLVASCVDWSGQVDILVNNAGVLPHHAPLIDETEKDYYEITDVNIKGVVFACKHVLPHMLSRHSGAICNISSTAAIRGRANLALYSLTKAAVSSMTRALAVRHGPDGVRVNAVLPNFVPTELNASEWQGWSEDQWRGEVERFPLRRVGTPADIGAAVVFLCSDAASWITGIELVVDGGFTVG